MQMNDQHSGRRTLTSGQLTVSCGVCGVGRRQREMYVDNGARMAAADSDIEKEIRISQRG